MDSPGSPFRFGITTSLVDDDAYNLVTCVVNDVTKGIVPGEVTSIISTRELGDDSNTDQRIKHLQLFLSDVQKQSGVHIPLILVSAKRFGRSRDKSEEAKHQYDKEIIDTMRRVHGELPEVVVMLGDMIVHGKKWCETIPSLNLHPDLPLSLGGKEGIYWDVIGNWVQERRDEGGGMIHLAIATLDAGTPISYFRIPLKGVVNGVNLGELWNSLPDDQKQLQQLVEEQTASKDKSTHPLFQELRRAEAQFEPALIKHTLRAFAQREIQIRGGRVFNREGRRIEGLDITHEVVGDLAIWAGQEGVLRRGKEGLV